MESGANFGFPVFLLNCACKALSKMPLKRQFISYLFQFFIQLRNSLWILKVLNL
jgi:hypothetical protein